MENRYKLTFEYDGTDFNGWQKQPEGRTVQGVIEKAMSTLYQQEIKIIGQGRTDSGVHAKAQVAHADLPEKFNISRLYRAMSGLLPKDLALVEAEKVVDNFHARFHATSRSYQYNVSQQRSPLKRHYSWFVFKPLVYERLSECGAMILGENDFINFCIPPDEPEMTTICTITNSSWKRQNGLLVYEIQGNRFLRHLVRRLVGEMIHVADGTREIKDFQHLLNSREIKQKGHAAPAKGLTLIDVTY